jgi:hypothetical protein
MGRASFSRLSPSGAVRSPREVSPRARVSTKAATTDSARTMWRVRSRTDHSPGAGRALAASSFKAAIFETRSCWPSAS